MFSKACEYGIRAMVYIATQSLDGKRVKISDVADNSGSPEAYTAKVLGLLTKHSIVLSHTGPNGGFEISEKSAREIKLSQIVSAIDGDSIYNGCGLGLEQCDAAHPCPLHDKFVEIRSELKKMLDTTTIYDLAARLKKGEIVLVR